MESPPATACLRARPGFALRTRDTCGPGAFPPTPYGQRTQRATDCYDGFRPADSDTMNKSSEPTPPLDPDARRALELIDGMRASKATFTALSLGVFDALHEGPASLDQLAERLHCAAHALERLLGACCGLELLELRDGQYQNRPVATRFLRVQSPDTLSGYMLYADRISFRLWGRLQDAVREGSHRWDQEFGSGTDIFAHFFATEEAKLTFLAGMHGLGLLGSPAIAAAFDLSRFRRLVDVGGGTGHLAIEVCRRYAGIAGCVFDLPKVTPVAQHYIAEDGLSGRITTADGDFFTDPLPQADLYGMGRILHDWSEEKVRFLLGKIFEALPSGGGLLICEKTLNEERDGPASGYLQSLNMLVCTEGRERTASEYEQLVRQAGFTEFAVRRTGRPLDAMLAVK
jgi:O-methyltransferase domain/Dimerisation domain